jgi:hypothetical protein
MILWNARRSHRTIVHYATLAIVTKTASFCLLAVTILNGFTAYAQKEHPISSNGKPLIFQLTRATVTREPQWTVQLQLPNGITSPDQLQMQQKSVWLRLDPSESFVIIEFSISNVKHKIDLLTKDVQLIDAKGSTYEAFGLPGDKKGQWCETGHMELDKTGQWSAMFPFCGALKKGNNDAISWLFKAPTTAIPGAKIVFQGAAYPLSVGN